MRYILCVFIFSLVSCSGPKELQEGASNEKIISLEKEGCFGTCPMYVFNIYKGGYCEFIGEKNTDKIGTHGLQLSKARYKEVLNAFKDSDFFEYDDYYESKLLDLPTITIYYKEGDREKTIRGKRERPDSIHKLQFQLEKIAESTQGWTVIDGKVEENKPEYDKTQIVLELVNGAQLSDWFNEVRKSYGIRILKRMDESFDNWLVSYNMKDFTPDEIMEVLKNDKNVSSAKFKRLDP